MLRAGGIDIYCWKGLNVARTWPTHAKQPNTPIQMWWRQQFRNALAAYDALSAYNKAFLRRMYPLRARSVRDEFIKRYLRGRRPYAPSQG